MSDVAADSAPPEAASPEHPLHDQWVKERTLAMEVAHQQRIGGTLTVAVDPRLNQSGTVYLAWGDKQGQSDFVLHVRRSADRGVTWSTDDLLTVPNATSFPW